MATITITIPDNMIDRVVDAVCARGRYSAFLTDGVTPNPQTKAQFAKAQVVMFLRHSTIEYEAEQAKLNNNIDVS